MLVGVAGQVEKPAAAGGSKTWGWGQCWISSLARLVKARVAMARLVKARLVLARYLSELGTRLVKKLELAR
jgi:hypothetical protein